MAIVYALASGLFALCFLGTKKDDTVSESIYRVTALVFVILAIKELLGK